MSKVNKSTLWFTVLDETNHADGFPKVLSYDKPATKSEEKVVLENLINIHLKDIKRESYGEKLHDCWLSGCKTDCAKKIASDKSGYFDKKFFEGYTDNNEKLDKNHYINNIVDKLLKNDFFVYNRYNKYYSVAFAINKKRFPVYSKDTDTVMIQWDEKDEYILLPSHPNNVCPVTGLINAIYQYQLSD